jgi:LCP family protein required for cell wall assembly
MVDLGSGRGERVWINLPAGEDVPRGGVMAPERPDPALGVPRRGGEHRRRRYRHRRWALWAARPPGGPGSPNHRRRPPWRWPRRALLVLNVIVVLCMAGTGSAYLYARYKVSQIPKVVVHGLQGVGRTAVPPPPGKPETILLVGSDSRAGFGKAQQAQFGSTAQAAGQRSDVIVLVHLIPATGKAAMLSIPRDSYLHIAGTNTVNRINSAFNNGPSQLIQTITQDYGIPINHYVEVNFTGLEGIVNTVGGICMYFPYPARDPESGLNIPTAGDHHLNGQMALALARSRFYQYYKGGQWIAEGTGDLGRITRQHEFLRVLAQTAVHRGIRNPFVANSLVSKGVRDVRVDSRFSTSDILRLIGEFGTANPGSTPSWTMPGTPYVTPGGADVLQPEWAVDKAVTRAWESYGMPSSSSGSKRSSTTRRSSPPPTVAVSSVHVEVLNGSGATGQAQQAAQALTSAGFKVANYGDANSYGYQSSIVTYGPGHEAQARTLAEHVKGGASINEDPNMSGPVITLTTGASYGGISAKALPGAVRSAPSSGSGGSGTTAGSSTGGASAASGSAKPPPWDPTACKA